MSYILDALRKAEQKRQLAAKVPTLATIHRQPVAVRPPIRLRLWPWVAGAVIVVECRHRDVAPAPGRDEVHRIAGQAGLILAPGTAAPSAPGATASPAPGPGAAPDDRSPCALGAGPSPVAPATPGRSRRRASDPGHGPPACVGIRSGDDPTRPRPSPGLGLRRRRPRLEPDQPRPDQKSPRRPSRLFPPRRRRPQTSPSRRRALRHSRGAGAGRPLAGSAGRGRGPARESGQAGRARAGITRRRHLRTRLRRCRICWRN